MNVPNADPALSPPGFNRSYSALVANVNGATLAGLPDGITFEAQQLNFASGLARLHFGLPWGMYGL